MTNFKGHFKGDESNSYSIKRILKFYETFLLNKLATVQTKIQMIKKPRGQEFQIHYLSSYWCFKHKPIYFFPQLFLKLSLFSITLFSDYFLHHSFIIFTNIRSFLSVLVFTSSVFLNVYLVYYSCCCNCNKCLVNTSVNILQVTCCD